MAGLIIGAHRGGSSTGLQGGERSGFNKLISLVGCGLRLEEALQYCTDVNSHEVAHVVQHAGFARRSDGKI